jgi:hypothetical protein
MSIFELMFVDFDEVACIVFCFLVVSNAVIYSVVCSSSIYGSDYPFGIFNLFLHRGKAISRLTMRLHQNLQAMPGLFCF